MGRRYTPRQQEIVTEWFNHTGFEFMPPDKGEPFYDALQRNKSWLEDHTNDALRIGNHYPPPRGR